MKLLEFRLLKLWLLGILIVEGVSQNDTNMWNVVFQNMTTNDFKEIHSKDTPEFCKRGHFLNLERNRCEHCPNGYFMPDLIHSQVRCYPCQHARPETAEIDLIDCTATSDTVIACKDGYFLKMAAVYDSGLVKCYPCTNCHDPSKSMFETRPCGQAVDTLCCPGPNMTAVQKDGELGYSCQGATLTSLPVQKEANYVRSSSHVHSTLQRSEEKGNDFYQTDATDELICVRGQFLKINPETKGISCQTCPDGTYMPVKRHYNTKCLPFSNLESQANCGSNCGEYIIILSSVLGFLVLLNLWLFLFSHTRIRNIRSKENKSHLNLFHKPLLMQTPLQNEDYMKISKRDI